MKSELFLRSFLLLSVAISLLAYGIMVYDKRQAVAGRRRIPESKLWWLAFCFGAAGILLGMNWPLYHKAAKTIFRIGIPLLFFLQVTSLLYLFFKA